jgi:ADP-ribosyl-[dinitrogen reductase] hydrolase
MNLSSTGGGGRGSDKGSIVGDVILHGKKKFWVRGGNYHYHHGLQVIRRHSFIS